MDFSVGIQVDRVMVLKLAERPLTSTTDGVGLKGNYLEGVAEVQGN